MAVNQQATPATSRDQGAAWQDLGGPYTITGTTLTVRLVEQRQRVRHRRRGPDRAASATAPPAREVAVLDGATAVADGTGSVAFGTTPVGTPLTRTFTVANTGTADLRPGGEPCRRVQPGRRVRRHHGGARGLDHLRGAVRRGAAGTFGGRVSFATNDAAANPYDFAVSATAAAPAPEIQVLDGTTALADSTGSVAFGTTPVGTPLTTPSPSPTPARADLNLGAMTACPPGSAWPRAGARRCAPGGSTTFAVRFDAASAGTFGGPVSFATDDPARQPLRLRRLRRRQHRPPAPAGAGGRRRRRRVRHAGPWTGLRRPGLPAPTSGTSPPAPGPDTATWTFTGLTPGQYRVVGHLDALLQPGHQRPVHRPRRLDGAGRRWRSTSRRPRRLHRPGGRLAGPGRLVHGRRHDADGAASDNANGYVIADAVRDRADRRPRPRRRRPGCSDGATGLADGTGSVAFGSTPVGTPLTRTFTVTNAGTADLTLGA